MEILHQPFTLTVLIYCFFYFLLFVSLTYLFPPLLRRYNNSLGLLVLGVSRKPLIIVAALFSLNFISTRLNLSPAIYWSQRGLNAAIVITLTYWLAQLFTQVISYYLRDYAKQTEALWDNVLVPILERLLPALTYILGTFLFLESLGIDLTGIWVAFGGLTFVLGFALRDILANFFSGLVLLIDTPFQFGDVIAMPDNSVAVIKNIGLRVTKLYLVETDCEVYIPNAALGSKDIVNLSRPTPHVAKTIEINVKAGTDQDAAKQILSSTVLGHPDTLGKITDKLENLDVFAGLKSATEEQLSKQDAGRKRLLAEEKVNLQLQRIETKFKYLIRAIKILEKGGLNEAQLKIVQKYYQEIIELTGLQLETDEKGEIKASSLTENTQEEDNLINLIRSWYQAWLEDPDLRIEDEQTLEEEWETKISILKGKINRLLQRILKPGSYETRLDDNALSLLEWLQNEFKAATTLWKEPAIRLSDVTPEIMKFTIKFYVDHIKLEHWERSNRVANEVRQEMLRRLTEEGFN